MFCSKCGNEIDDEALICPKCGQTTKNMAANTQKVKKSDTSSGEKPKVNVKALIIVAAAVVVAIIILIIVLVGGGKKSSVSVSTANSNAKTANTAFSSVLTQLGFGGYDFGTADQTASVSFNCSSSGSYNVKWSGVSKHPSNSEIDLEAYLTSCFPGYAYVVFEPKSCTVKYTLWSPEPIPEKYLHQLSTDEISKSYGEGTVVGCYPVK